MNRLRNTCIIFVIGWTVLTGRAGATGDYSVDFSATDLPGGHQTGAIYSGQTIMNSEMSAGDILSSTDYALHPVHSKPNLSVTSGLILMPDGYGPIDYGFAVLGGAPVAQTFTVYNNGSAPLMLLPPTCPLGFSVTKSYAAILEPQTGDTFEVSMASNAIGFKVGSVTFSNNDIDSQSFAFSVYGRVLAAADIVWLDFTWSGDELGTEPLPFNTAAEAVSLVNTSGIIRIKASSTAAQIRITKPLRIESVGGTSRVGAN